MHLILILKVLFAALTVYFGASIFKSIRRAQYYIVMIKKTPALSENSRPGDWIKFSGRVTYPETKTEFLRTPCSCWHSKVNAIFTSKKKKPSKGEITHRPKLYENSSNNQPLMISDGKTSVQCLFDHLWKILLNPKRKSKYTKFPPNEEIKRLTKPKYRAFEIHESFFSPRAEVILLAKLLTISGGEAKACEPAALGVVSGSSDKDRPPLLFEGSERELHQIYRRKIFIALALLIYIGLVDHMVWQALTSIDQLDFVVASGVVCFAVLFFIRKYVRV